MQSNKGKLYLIPNLIADNTQDQVITPHLRQTVQHLDYFLAEDVRTARRFLSSLKIFDSIERLQFETLDKDTTEAEAESLLKPVRDGRSAGIVSESGCPGIADPGALAVRAAHKYGIQVIPLVGPSSLLLALMASGLSGQNFTFNGYAPIEKKEAAQTLKDCEMRSIKRNETQIFIETPYRNNQLLSLLLASLKPRTRLTIGVDITGAHESIVTKTVHEWKNSIPELPKLPAVFLFHGQL